MVRAMRQKRAWLSVALIAVAAACQPSASPTPSESLPGGTDVAPEVEPSATPEEPISTGSPVAPAVEPSQTPEQPLVAPAAPSQPPEEPLDY